MTTARGDAAYDTEPITDLFGVVARGLDLSNPDAVPAETVERIKHDVFKHRLVVFKGLGKLSAEAQLKISGWFGDVESTFYRHPASPHPDIFRVSNDEQQGCRNVGRSGWHIDGSFQQKPFKIQTMHFWSVSKDGHTHFSPLRELLESLSDDARGRWDRYWFVGDRVVHPLTYNHPTTGERTMVFHCGGAFARAIAVDYDAVSGAAAEVIAGEGLQSVLDQITARLEDPARKYVHRWDVGDLAIIDNLAVGHYAPPATQDAAGKAGLRILHRTTVAGTTSPRKAGATPDPA